MDKLIIFFILVGLFFTNPNKIDFIKFGMRQMGSIYGVMAESSNSKEDEASLNLLLALSGASIKVQNYFIFSIFSINDGTQGGKVLGIAKNFFVLGNNSSHSNVSNESIKQDSTPKDNSISDTPALSTEINNATSVNEDNNKVESVPVEMYLDNLNSKLLNFEKPVLHFTTGKFLIRIDKLSNNNFRYVSWNYPKNSSDEPNTIVKNGYYDDTSSSYIFPNKNYQYRVILSDNTPCSLEAYKDNERILQKDIKEVFFNYDVKE